MLWPTAHSIRTAWQAYTPPPHHYDALWKSHKTYRLHFQYRIAVFLTWHLYFPIFTLLTRMFVYINFYVWERWDYILCLHNSITSFSRIGTLSLQACLIIVLHFVCVCKWVREYCYCIYNLRDGKEGQLTGHLTSSECIIETLTQWF